MGKQESRSAVLFRVSGYLVAAASLAAILTVLQAPQQPPTPLVAEMPTPQQQQPFVPVRTTTAVPARTSKPTTSTPLPAPQGHRQVRGAHQLVTILPDGWNVTAGQVTTVAVATNPGLPGREVRFGGAPPEAPSKTLHQRITGEHQKKTGKSSYTLLNLQSTMINGYPAVRWEYSSTAEGATRNYAGNYWEANGIEYVIFATSTPDQWPATRDLLELMTTYAKP